MRPAPRRWVGVRSPPGHGDPDRSPRSGRSSGLRTSHGSTRHRQSSHLKWVLARRRPRRDSSAGTNARRQGLDLVVRVPDSSDRIRPRSSSATLASFTREPVPQSAPPVKGPPAASVGEVKPDSRRPLLGGAERWGVQPGRSTSPRAGFEQDGRHSPIDLHCSCGAVFGCRDSPRYSTRCPWSLRCRGSEGCPAMGGPPSDESLLATCPSCGAVQRYERRGSPRGF